MADTAVADGAYRDTGVAGEDTAVADAHARPAEQVLAELGVDPSSGLASAEAAGRLERHGPNKLPEPERESNVVRFLRQFQDVLIYVLIVSGILTAFLQEWADTIVIALVVIVNAVVGYIQEGKAEKALEGIRGMLSSDANVRRDGSWSVEEAEDLVPGDLVRLGPGDRVPADLRLIEATELSVEESALTGESEPARKDTAPIEADAGLGDRTSMAFSSTMVTGGTALGVVVGTGQDTEIGRINTMMTDVDTLETPLTRKIAAFSTRLALAVLVLSVVLFLVSWLVHDTPVADTLRAVVGFAVAAIPEGLPALITITLALGVQTMARSRAITRKLPAVQTLGSVTTICTDKTGTLTTNEMTVVRAVVAGEEFEVTGTGYAPEGEVTRAGERVGPEHVGLRRLAQVMGLANDTDLVPPGAESEARDADAESEDADAGGGSRWSISGEPTEGALKSFAVKVDPSGSEAERIATLPFSSENKLMGVTAHLDGATRVLVKGAPDRLLERSTRQLTADGDRADLDRGFWAEEVERLSGQGLRVLAAAAREGGAEDEDDLRLDEIGQGLTFVGLAGIVDPPREEATEAISVCQDAGITVKMTTGDHAGTATAIAREMGIDDGAGAVTGAQLEAASDEELAELARTHNVFARTSPEHKLRLVQALQGDGEIVAMTGDGVNDAPALRRADVGVAMGIKGTEVTKESAELVLADDNFATIATAVRQGRRIYDNLRKALVFLLPTNGAQGTVIAAAMLLGWTLPLTPIQVLWVNMVTAVTLAFAFAFEPAEDDIMRRRPSDPGEGLVLGRHVVQIALASLLIAGATITAFVWRVNAGEDLATARTLATTVLVACQACYLFNVKALERTSLRPSVLFSNKVAWIVTAVMIALQALFVYAPFMHSLFGTTTLSVRDLGVAVLIGLGVFLVIELLKGVLYRGGRSQRGPGREPRHAD